MESPSPDYLETLGAYAVRYVKPGQTVGLGTGRAAAAFIQALGRSALRVRGVPTSKASEALGRSLGIELVDLADAGTIASDFDGADEVDPRLNLIKGYGGALVREKVVAASSRRFIVLVGAEKLVRTLGHRGSLPVEIVPFAAPLAIRLIAKMGLRPKVRRTNGADFVTDNGNLILDCGVKEIRNPARLDRELLAIPGVVGTGLFVGMADMVLVADPKGPVRVIRPR
ncbi:MAG TPA: ribose-5-phosphate isomerase RpiA [Candidatus Binataceae bacterium]|nr:ribose-5-phosphate isomerase RpiA [Candidatus Binataceae bacterium]